jgi:hypothetical protein
VLSCNCPCTTFDRGALVDELEGAAVLVGQRRAADNAVLSYKVPVPRSIVAFLLNDLERLVLRSVFLNTTETTLASVSNQLLQPRCAGAHDAHNHISRFCVALRTTYDSRGATTHTQ